MISYHTQKVEIVYHLCIHCVEEKRKENQFSYCLKIINTLECICKDVINNVIRLYVL